MASLEVVSAWALVVSGLALESPLSDLMGHELRRTASQGSRFTSSDPCLGKERLAIGSSRRTLAGRSMSGGDGVGYHRRWRRCWASVGDGDVVGAGVGANTSGVGAVALLTVALVTT